MRLQRFGSVQWSTVRVVSGNADPVVLLEKLCRALDLTLTVDPVARHTLTQSRVSSDMFEAQREEALSTLFRSLTPRPAIGYTQQGTAIHVFPVALDRDNLPIRNVTLHYPQGTPLETVLTALLAGTYIRYAWNGSPVTAGTMRVDLVNVPFRKALETVLAQAKMPPGTQLHYEFTNSVLQISRWIELPAASLGRQPITVTANAVPLRHLLHRAFIVDPAFHLEIMPDVMGTVTDSFTNIPREQALPRILQHCTVPVELHVYQSDQPGLPQGGMLAIIRRR